MTGERCFCGAQLLANEDRLCSWCDAHFDVTEAIA